MKKSYLTVVLTLTCLLGLGISACAQNASNIVVNVPFEFVAGGKTLPAGTYSVGRVFSESDLSLNIRSHDNGIFLLPVVFNGASVEQAKLSFEHIGETYFLSGVRTPAGVYTIETPRAITKLAQMKDHGTRASSGN
ncbi:MAG: hypothetical protein ABSF85_05840 [Terriglobales bacterium]|jgi:hypothetical protein